MIPSQIAAKIGFYERIIARIKMRSVVSDPCGHIMCRDIDVDDAEVEKIQNGLFDLYESMTEIMSGGYEDVNNFMDDITYMIQDLNEYTGCLDDRAIESIEYCQN